MSNPGTTPPRRRFEDKNPPPENKDAPCNICGRGWPYHEATCAYRATADALADALSALKYIEQRYGRLDGVGWGRVLGA